LPDEGESLMVTRRDGELVCQTVAANSTPDGISDAELYGRLVLANERLNRLGIVPLWSCGLATFAVCVAFFQLSGIGWPGWYAGAGILAVAALSCSAWIAARRDRLFRRDVVPMLEAQMRRRKLNRYALVGAIRQHPELSSLLTELARGSD